MDQCYDTAPLRLKEFGCDIERTLTWPMYRLASINSCKASYNTQYTDFSRLCLIRNHWPMR